MTTLYISEAFGPTFQGEGRNLGQRAHFLRLAGCNLTCTWCDAAYTWDWRRFDKHAEVHPWSLEEAVDWVIGSEVEHLVITGGEPLLQARALTKLLDALPELLTYEVETNGTLFPPLELIGLVDQWNVSPKLSNSGVPLARRWSECMTEWGRLMTADFKFVVDDIARDLPEIDGMVQAAGLDPRHVWLMPQGTDSERISVALNALSEAALLRGYNLTTRLHIHTWGNKRGV